MAIPDEHPTSDIRRTLIMRVLVASGDVRSLYASTITRAIRELRPGLEMRSSGLKELELESFVPHVVVCSQPNGEHPSARGAWAHVPTGDGVQDDERLAGICLDGEIWRTDGPPLSELLGVLDETHRRLGEGELEEAC